MKDNLMDFTLYKKKKEYNKDNFYTPVFNAFMRNIELNIQEKAFFIYLQGFGFIFKDLERNVFKIKLRYVKNYQ